MGGRGTAVIRGRVGGCARRAPSMEDAGAAEAEDIAVPASVSVVAISLMAWAEGESERMSTGGELTFGSSRVSHGYAELREKASGAELALGKCIHIRKGPGPDWGGGGPRQFVTMIG
jgi:hypothetical protein